MSNALAIFITAASTYLLRAFPMLICKKKIESKFLQSFFYYLPYAVISAMTFPSIFYCTGNKETAIIGTILSIILAFFKVSLILVIIIATAVVYIATILL